MNSRKELLQKLQSLTLAELKTLSQNEFESIEKSVSKIIDKAKDRRRKDELAEIYGKLHPSEQALHKHLNQNQKSTGSIDQAAASVEETKQTASGLRELIQKIKKSKTDQALEILSGLDSEKRKQLSLLAHVTDSKGKRKNIPAGKSGQKEWIESLRNVRTRGILSGEN